MKIKPVESSSISHIGYEPEMRIWFAVHPYEACWDRRVLVAAAIEPWFGFSIAWREDLTLTYWTRKGGREITFHGPVTCRRVIGR